MASIHTRSTTGAAPIALEKNRTTEAPRSRSKLKSIMKNISRFMKKFQPVIVPPRPHTPAEQQAKNDHVRGALREAFPFF